MARISGSVYQRAGRVDARERSGSNVKSLRSGIAVLPDDCIALALLEDSAPLRSRLYVRLLWSRDRQGAESSGCG